MNEANFVRRINFFPTGDVYLAEQEIPLTAVRDVSTFQSVASSPLPVAAFSTLTATDVPDDTEEITIGGMVYIFDVAALTNEPNHVLIGTLTATLANLRDAINNDATEGTDYGTRTPQNPHVIASAATATTLLLTARVAGAQGNTIMTSPTSIASGVGWEEGSFTGDALAGGTGNPGDDAIIPTLVSDGLQFDDGETAFLQFTIPMDYHPSGNAENDRGDQCALRLHVHPTAANNTTDIGVTTAQTIFRAGVALITTVRTAEAETAVAATTNAREAILDLSGSDFQPGDVVKLTLDVNAAGTDELVLTGIDFIYGSCMAAYNDDDRFRDLGTSAI